MCVVWINFVGEEWFKEQRWNHDTFQELFNYDALWAYLIQVSEELPKIDREKLNNLVLCCLMMMGMWDWLKGEGEDLHQATRAIRFLTAVASWLLPMILDREAKVHHLQLGGLFQIDKYAYSEMLWMQRSIFLIDVLMILWLRTMVNSLGLTMICLSRKKEPIIIGRIAELFQRISKLEETCARKDKCIHVLEVKVK